MVGFTHALRHEYGSEPVGFSAICPGFISRVGMYGRLEKQVGEPPGMVGTLPPERVGDAVVRAIPRNLPEVIVAKGPVRPLILLNAFSPRAMTRLSRTKAATDFARRMERIVAGPQSPLLVALGPRTRLAVLLQSEDRRKEVVLT